MCVCVCVVWYVDFVACLVLGNWRTDTNEHNHDAIRTVWIPNVTCTCILLFCVIVADAALLPNSKHIAPAQFVCSSYLSEPTPLGTCVCAHKRTRNPIQSKARVLYYNNDDCVDDDADDDDDDGDGTLQ